MKRYDVYADDNGPSVEEERPNGVYVYYEDAARILAQRDRLAELLREFDRLDDVVVAMDWDLRRVDALAELDKEKQQ